MLNCKEEINIIKKDLNKILEILNVIVKDQQYDNDVTLIKKLIMKTNQILNNDINITDDFLDEMDEDLNYLDQKCFAKLVYLKDEYVELNDIIRLFTPIKNYYKKKNHNLYVKKIREENKKSERRLKITDDEIREKIKNMTYDPSRDRYIGDDSNLKITPYG